MKKIDTENRYIIFSYPKNDLFNNVSQKTAYKSRFISDDRKVVDELTMLDDDKSAFEASLYRILADVHERAMKLSSGVQNAFEVTEDDINIKIQNNESYNYNLLDIVDSSLYDCLEIGALKEWYSICGNSSYEAEYNEKYIRALNALSNRMFQLKKKPIKNTLGMFE